MPFIKPKKNKLRKELTPEEFFVTQENGTEPPFNNRYWNNHEEGIYVDIVSGEVLFSSTHKFDSNTGWPSFTMPVSEENVTEHEDNSLRSLRIEVRSRLADSHLGHVFDDGSGKSGRRYCINSAALRFIHKSEMVEQGYGEYMYLFQDKSEQT
ncbi:peptide-methionine (R)-S-oxide reductase MsrB [Desulfonatronovibrio magnus]|uniref:peptide-methionine (R)-S-oxide reductase MsrB n=1 Tax=Desulfonatronovibrio magnus TaxID=698827 RepID=UPI000A5AFB37